MGESKSDGGSEIVVDWDVLVQMPDGTPLRADVFRPKEPGKYPVILSHGPYGKGLAFQTGYPTRWNQLINDFPEVLRGSSGRYANWETVDPERWVPDGYVCVRVDSRGAGASPGFLDPFSEQEIDDFYWCIEWAGQQEWSNGRVGLSGISYYAMSQWLVAARRPPHLRAIFPFEGASDFYRDAVRHGGILNTFWIKWFPLQVESVQYGVGANGHKNENTGEFVAGPETFDADTLVANRVNLEEQQREHHLLDAYFKERTPDLQKIEVPVLSAGNWGGVGLHLRGNVEGFLAAGSKQKWLEMHGLEHWTHFYTDYGVGLQKRFFDHFLKGMDNGWDKQPPIILNVRRVDGFERRDEYEWPIARTVWTKYLLDSNDQSLDVKAPECSGASEFDALSSTVTFRTAPFTQEAEFTGPVSAKLYVSSSTINADLFLTLRLFGPGGNEVLFAGAIDPKTPISQGWLRLSHRELDSEKTLPYRPWRTHTTEAPVVPNEIYEVDVEIWPTSIVVPPGYRLALTVGGADFEHGLEPSPSTYPGRTGRGSGSLLHDDDRDRNPDVFGGKTTIYTGAVNKSYVLLPLIPKQ